MSEVNFQPISSNVNLNHSPTCNVFHLPKNVKWVFIKMYYISYILQLILFWGTRDDDKIY